jgi:methyl-accepting chemotaxis protein
MTAAVHQIAAQYRRSTQTQQVDLADRVRLYRLDSAFAEGLRQIGEILDESVDEFCDVYWRHMLAVPELRDAYPPHVVPQLKAGTAAVIRRKLRPPVDQEWAELIAEQGDICTDHNLPGRVLVAALAECYWFSIEKVMTATADDPVASKSCLSAIHKLRTTENELVLTRITVNNRQDEMVRVKHQSDAFQRHVIGAVERLELATQQVFDRAVGSSGAAGDMLARSTEVATCTGESAEAMRRSALMIDQLVERIGVAERQLSDAVRLSNKAAVQSASTKDIISGLAETVQSVDTIVEAIRKIAGQTRLLSLNATIEAARAGHAGRGFAIVAQEVKSLSAQTEEATRKAAELISKIQAATGRTVTAGEAVAKWVAQVDEAARKSHGDLNSQLAIAASIAESVDETSSRMDSVSQHIDAVQSTAENVSAALAAMESATGEAGGDLVTLRAEVCAFLDLIEQELR